MNLDEYDYDLPGELIAQRPAERRDSSRLMVVDTENNTVGHTSFERILEHLTSHDLLVVNDTKVFPARLIGKKEKTGGTIEIFLLHPYGDGTWDALSRPGRRLREGTVVTFGEGALSIKVLEKGTGGHVRVHLESEMMVDDAIDTFGTIPLPPYIKRDPDTTDTERYQTVYARHRGAVAAPTAGLHFTGDMLDRLEARGIERVSITLHVGIGTFRPLEQEAADGETLHREFCRIPESTVEMLNDCRKRGGRIIAVGTTTVRALESASRNNTIGPYEGWTDLFIKPPYEFKTVDSVITNFHLPRSSLLMLVCAFAGRERILSAYKEAVRERYRFYSYGDTMFITGKAP